MHTDPRTKEQFLNRILSYDFDGDLANLGESKAVISRTAPNKVGVIFPTTGQTYELVVRKPRAKPTRKVVRLQPKAAPRRTRRSRQH